MKRRPSLFGKWLPYRIGPTWVPPKLRATTQWTQIQYLQNIFKKIWKYQFLHLKQMKKKNHCGCKKEGIECYFEPEEMMRFWGQYQEGECVVYFSLIVSFWLFPDRSRIELFFWRRIGPVLMVMRRKIREKKSDRRR